MLNAFKVNVLKRASPLRSSLSRNGVRSISASVLRGPHGQKNGGHGSSARASPWAKRMLMTAFAGSAIVASATSSSSSATCLNAAACDAVVATPKETFRLDYKPSAYKIPELHLDFDLGASRTIVTTTSLIEPQASSKTDLVLDGEDCIKLLSIKINGITISADDYKIQDETLRISSKVLPPVAFKLETEVEIAPDQNLQLAGLYASGSKLLCTQCEAMGFRRITYHMDRPDILSKYTVRLEGDKDTYPLLLSNGNQINQGDLPDGRHYTVWEDPFLKPSYLFAVVAGDLGSIHDTFTTKSGKEVKLGIFCEKEDAHKLDHAMYSIKESMKWDENTFGLECDLDTYNIVATSDFNMGAMENKGLNVFNSAYVLADSKSATDADFENILGVIGHEYFHNWTGNRVTVRDWFQLTLKEGLTVFRDQWFSSDMTSAAVKRISDVRGLRGRQFAEDAGPMAHPVRPESYISMDNFYTSTVYSKGAEIVRMYSTLLGKDGFKKGMKLYFERHDGSAVTCDDFRAAMADANGRDLSQFERWYTQAGTPALSITHSYDAVKKTFTLNLKQRTPTTPGPNQKEEEKKPLLMPVELGLLSKATGAEIMASTVLTFDDSEKTYVFDNIQEEPIPSVMRGFSAPVKVEQEQSDAELAFLMAHDTDSFNRWDASNRLSTKVIMSLVEKDSIDEINSSTLPANYIDAIRTSLSNSKKGDSSLLAFTVQLPDLTTLSQAMTVVDVDKLVAARKHVKKSLRAALQAEFERVYEETKPSGEYVFSAQETGRRRLRNTCLDYLSSEGSASSASRSKQQFDSANCMTDNIAAFGTLASQNCVERDSAIAKFHESAAGDALVLNKWFTIQAMADLPDLLSKVKELKNHKDFLVSNPNRFRSLIGAFAGNMPHFHAADGEGYKFISDCIIEIDALNPQVAARMAGVFSPYKRFDSKRQAMMEVELKKIKAKEGLSKDTFEVVSRCLA